jgi:peroxiredoxin
MPGMEVLQKQFKEKNFVLLTISVDYEGIKPVRELINKHQYTFPVLLDPKCESLDLFDVKGIPTTFLVDKKGGWESNRFKRLEMSRSYISPKSPGWKIAK